MNDLEFEISGISALKGRVIDIDEWARMMQIPDRHSDGFLGGEAIAKILGIHGKAWDPEVFTTIAPVVAAGRAAMESARIGPDDVDLLVLVTCTPYHIKLGQDGFHVARELGLRDDIPAMQLEAGCGGLARAVQMVGSTTADRVLVVAYNAVSPHATGIYRKNQLHPFASTLWASPGIFSDAVGALVMTRTEGGDGFQFYSRDQRAFGDGPGFEDPIVHYPGGGTAHPPGSTGAEELSAYAMSGKIIAEYYSKGMILNHQTLLERRPTLLSDITRFYTHQAGPAMVANFLDLVELDPALAPTNAAELGNLVSPCTIVLLDDDVRAGAVVPGDEICISVVGAGPERGAFVTRMGDFQVVELHRDDLLH